MCSTPLAGHPIVGCREAKPGRAIRRLVVLLLRQHVHDEQLALICEIHEVGRHLSNRRRIVLVIYDDLIMVNRIDIEQHGINLLGVRGEADNLALHILNAKDNTTTFGIQERADRGIHLVLANLLQGLLELQSLALPLGVDGQAGQIRERRERHSGC